MSLLFERCRKNPILTADDLPRGTGYHVLNPGAIKFDGEYILLVDVFHREGGIIFWLARSQNGVDFKFDPAPVDWESPPLETGWKENGVYDPRITKIGDEYFIIYGSNDNSLGTRLAIAKTEDFLHFQHVSLCSEINNRNGAIFPEKINGMYCRLERPFGAGESSPSDMWLAFSNDMKFWGGHRKSLCARPFHWDHHKVGAGAPPIRVPEGWLEIYHGVNPNCDGFAYMLFAVILDYQEPWKELGRTKFPILYPEMPYEKMGGRVDNVVFTCNAIPEEDGTLKIYYGAADHCICLATAKIRDVIDACYEPYQFIMNPVHVPVRQLENSGKTLQVI